MNSFRSILAVTATVGVVAGCSSSATPTAATTPSPAAQTSTSASAPPSPVATAVPAGAERTLAEVPWSKVGPGWMLAQWSPVTPHPPGVFPAPGEPTSQTASTTLFLVDPAGTRYTVTSFPPGSDLSLTDWSGDGSHALFSVAYSITKSAVSVDLRTGEKTTVPVDGFPRYTRPNGTALLVSTMFNGDDPGTLKRVDLQGNTQLTYPTDDLGGAGQFSGYYEESPDGTQLVLGTANLGNKFVPRSDNSLVVLNNDGTVARTLTAPMPKAMCEPVTWSTSGTLLAHCRAEGDSANQLWEVPLDGAAPTALTAVNSAQQDDPGFGGNLGDRNAWTLPSGTFLQSAGAGCSVFLSKATSDGHTTRVQIPDVSGGAAVAGVADDRLVLLSQPNCGGTSSLVSYDPAANTSTVLLGPPVNGGSVSRVLLHP